MLQQLFIRNYAIIDSIRINFTDGLNIITGETGAGKSILMGALGLILGDRADTSALSDNKEKCIVEGLFNNNLKEVSDFLHENNLDEDSAVIIRREISPNGKSRAFINDTPVTLNQLKDLSVMLVDMHRQFDTQNLNKSDFQLQVLDSLSGNNPLLSEYQSHYEKLKLISHETDRLLKEQKEADIEHGYTQFLFDELEKAGFRENEIEESEAELKLLEHAEGIKENLNRILYKFNEGEEPLLLQLKSMLNDLDSSKTYLPELSALSERLKSSLIELKDIASEIESVNDKVSYSEKRLNELKERLDKAYTLLKKHGVTSTNDLLQISDELKNKLNNAGDLSDKIKKLEGEKIKLTADVRELAARLSKKRKGQLPDFPLEVNKLLHIVGMPNAGFKAEINELPEPGGDGMDKVEFLFNANKTEFQPLYKVASGGELSRLMLIIKSLVAGSMQLPTLIFDEIDSGISGEAARQAGNIIKNLSNKHQILLITHQAQIAAKAHTHFHVYKENKSGRILTGIKQLNQEERIKEIATMLSGAKPTAAAFANAREMMN